MWALALCDLGRFEEASEAVVRGRELSSEDDFASQNAWRLAAALVASARREHEGATSLVDEALVIIDDTDYLAWQAETREVRGGCSRRRVSSLPA